MNQKLLIILCAMVAQVGFAQTTRTPTPLVTPPPSSADEAPSNIATGVVKGLTGEVITIKTHSPNPVSFAISKTARYVDKKGKAIPKERVKPGVRVRIEFEGNEDTRTATRIVVED